MKLTTGFVIAVTMFSVCMTMPRPVQAETSKSPVAAASRRPNVLLITIDDLNDWTGCLGGHPQAKTPNIDRLAERGVLFTNAHCQAPICNPSRTSFLLGLRPSTTGIYQNRPWFRTTAANKDRVTLTQYFRRHGYESLSAGKIYHGSRVDKPSFDVVGPRTGQRLDIDERQIHAVPALSRSWDFGPQQYAEEKFSDVIDGSWGIARLEEERNAPFIMAIGFYRPHVPWYAPPRFFEERPFDVVILPTVLEGDRDDLPEAARTLTINPKPPTHDWFLKSGHWKTAVRAYLASTTFMDAQVGRLLAALDESRHAENTIVVLLSDHGFHLGEKQRWAKHSLWERSTRVPLIVSLPGGLRGARCTKPVELLSLYPTLIELCGLPVRDDLEGMSIVPLLRNPKAEWNRPALTTYRQNNHAVRSDRHRYIRYADGSEELYDHRTDPHEWHNLAGDKKYASLIAEHARWLPKKNVADTFERNALKVR